MKWLNPIYTDESSVIIPLKYFHIRNQTDNATVVEITIEWSCDEYSGMPKSAKLKICKSDKPITESTDHNGLYKWAGFPIFVQNCVQPISDDGRLYHYICTIQNNWADMGNANIFALIGDWEDDILVVEDVFVEASCH